MAKPNSQAPSSKAWRPLTVKTDEELEELLVQPGIKGSLIDISQLICLGWREARCVRCILLLSLSVCGDA